ncbi:hypothetical protein [Streptomyces sp. NPDC058441]|uniref:hypothetical protein n=1 Tax=Streptomyces sp. NPDC058441 TaxID=3346502 RepID=UPI003662F8F2
MSDVRAPVEPSTGVLVHSARDRELASAHWLLSAALAIKEARREWAENGITVLRCGGLFTAIRISASIVHAAAGTEDPVAVSHYLARVLRGPVFADQASRRFYALVPASTQRLSPWHGTTVPEAECLGANCFVGVPRPGRDDPREFRCHWVVPMDGPADLCSPHAVTQLLNYGRFRLAAAESAADE